MSKSRARLLAELLNESGRVKKEKSQLTGGDSTIDLDTIPTIPNSKLQNSSISIAGHSTALGGSVSLNTGDITEHTDYKYYTDARVRAAVSVTDSGGDGSLAYNSSTGVITYTGPSAAEVRAHITASTGISITDGAISTASIPNASLTNSSVTINSNSLSLGGTLTLDTDDVGEGSTNLYYTDARVGSYLSTNSYATQSYVGTQIANLVDSAPGTLNTLNELAAALGDDANFSTTVTNSIATKLPLAGGTLTGALSGTSANFSGDIIANGIEIGTAYGSDSQYLGIKRSAAGSNDYILIQGSSSDAGSTYLTAGSGANVYIRANSNSATNQLVVTTSGSTIGGNTIWHAGNDGSGSGLDADTVDGFHVDSNNGGLVKSYQDQGSGTFHSTISEKRSSMGMAYMSDGPNSGSDWYRFIQPSYREGSGGSNVWQTQLAFYGTGGDFYLRQREGGSFGSSGWGSWTRVWTSGTDGSGSGLDADLLDGLDSGIFFKSYTNNNGGWSQSNRNFSVRSGGDAVGLHMEESDGTFGFQLYGNGSQYGFLDGEWANWDLRKTTNGAFEVDEGSGLQRVWNAGNDGSGSGLDADTVDGIQAASFLRSDAADSATQRITFSANDTHNYDTIATASGSQGCIEIYNNGAGNDAFMTFHVGSDYACYFGLDGGTNKLSVGGWSMGANSYEIYHSGNKPTLAALGYTGATNANYITNNNQLTNGAGYITSSGTASQSHMVSGSAFSTSAAPDSVLEYAQASGITDTKVAPDGSWYNSIRMGHGDPYTYYSNTIAVKMTGSGVGDIYTQTISNNTAQGWNKHWHANNDGSGSGLDADLLDGKHHTNFGATLATYGTTAGASGRIRCTAPFNTNSGHMFQVTVSLYENYTCHTYVVSGYMYSTNNQWYASKAIYTGTGSPDIVVGRDSNGKAYISIANGNYMGVRVHNMTMGYQTSVADTYDPWTITVNAATENSVTPTISKVWHSTNDGSGSGLDADYVDGVEASSFLRSDANDTASGQYTFSKTNDHAIRVGTVRGTAVGSLTGEYIHMYERVHIGSPSGWGSINAPQYGLSTYGNCELAAYSGRQVTIGGTGSNNAYNTISSTRLCFGGSNDPDNYHIGTNMENYGGNYTKLDLRWHTGIRMGAQQQYGGVRIFDSEDLGSLLFSIGKGDNRTRVENGDFVVHNGEINCGAPYLGNMQNGAVNIGRTDTDYAWSGTTWASDIRAGFMANCSETWEFVVHDSGDSVDSFMKYNGTNFEMGNDIGWGTTTFTFASNVYVNGSVNRIGNGNGHYLHVNDTLFVGATDSGDSHFYFGENSSNWYGEHWYWDSGHETEKYSRHAGTDTLIEKYDTRYTHKVQTNRGYERLSHSSGYQIGSYNSVGANSAKTNPIYTIGDNYRPSDTSLSNMYGIGYAHPNLWGSGKTSSWGMYVCEGGAYKATLGGGDVTAWFASKVYAAGYYYNSDRSLKENIKPLENSLEKVQKLQGVSYNLIETKEEHIGFIAQEVEEVVPELVKGEEGEKVLNYAQMVALLTEAVKEQQAQIQNLQKELGELKNAKTK